MQSLADISSAEFREAVTPERVRIGMIIQGGLAAGVFSFFAVLIILITAHDATAPLTDDKNIFGIMTIVNFIFYMITLIVGNILYRSRFSQANLKRACENDFKDRNGNPISVSPAEKAITVIRTAMIIRTALMEASAFFGLIVIMQSALSGQLQQFSWLWINLIPAATMIILVIITFPTAGKLEEIFEKMICGK